MIVLIYVYIYIYIYIEAHEPGGRLRTGLWRPSATRRTVSFQNFMFVFAAQTLAI